MVDGGDSAGERWVAVRRGAGNRETAKSNRSFERCFAFVFGEYRDVCSGFFGDGTLWYD